MNSLLAKIFLFAGVVAACQPDHREGIFIVHEQSLRVPVSEGVKRWKKSFPEISWTIEDHCWSGDNCYNVYLNDEMNKRVTYVDGKRYASSGFTRIVTEDLTLQCHAEIYIATRAYKYGELYLTDVVTHEIGHILLGGRDGHTKVKNDVMVFVDDELSGHSCITEATINNYNEIYICEGGTWDCNETCW